LLAYLGATFLFLADIFVRHERSALWGRRVLSVALVLNVAAIVWALVEGGPARLLSMPRGLLVAAPLPAIGYRVMARRSALTSLGALVAPLSLLLVCAVLWSWPQVVVSAPLRHGLLPVHIVLALVGTSAFALAFFAAILYAVQAWQLKQKKFGALFQALPPLDELDRVGFRCISVGFPIYTAALLLGFVFWASQGGGERYTSYALATTSWFIYGVVLQARLTWGWRGTRAAVLTAFGFLTAASVVIAYVVN